MYIIGDNPIKSKDDFEVISNRQFMKIYTAKLTKGLIKNTDESCSSHLYKMGVNTDDSALICCQF